jgi:phenol 2-monooxygenase (NADPH)
MIIPREGDLIRLYVQLSDKEVIDPKTGRVDREKMGPEKVFEVRIFCPFSFVVSEWHYDSSSNFPF